MSSLPFNLGHDAYEEGLDPPSNINADSPTSGNPSSCHELHSTGMF